MRWRAESGKNGGKAESEAEIGNGEGQIFTQTIGRKKKEGTGKEKKGNEAEAKGKKRDEENEKG